MSAMLSVQPEKTENTKQAEYADISDEEWKNDGETDHPFEPTATGLTDSEVESLRKQYGYNELSEMKQNPFLKFLSYFWGPIPWMIEIAAILSAFVKHWEDLVVISILLVVNAIVGF